MNDKLLVDKTHDALTKWVKPKVCLINDAVGNILKYKDNFYIVTCEHVTKDFFENKNSYIILDGNSRIYSDDLKYFGSIDNEIDVALIEVKNNDSIKNYFEEKDLEVIDNFSNYNFNNSSLFIFGFPKQFVIDKENKQYFHYISYGAELSKEKSSDDKYIYIEYDRSTERRIINEKELKAELPSARGLSGAFIFKIDRFEKGKNDIWDPASVAKAVAIQIEWNKRSWLRGVNIKYLFELLKKINR